MDWLRNPIIALAFVATASVTGAASADPYFNSTEPGCDGSDPNVLTCDDFEDGDWYVTDGDTAGGLANPDNDGWGGTIYANPITPSGDGALRPDRGENQRTYRIR